MAIRAGHHRCPARRSVLPAWLCMTPRAEATGSDRPDTARVHRVGAVVCRALAPGRKGSAGEISSLRRRTCGSVSRRHSTSVATSDASVALCTTALLTHTRTIRSSRERRTPFTAEAGRVAQQHERTDSHRLGLQQHAASVSRRRVPPCRRASSRRWRDQRAAASGSAALSQSPTATPSRHRRWRPSRCFKPAQRLTGQRLRHCRQDQRARLGGGT